MNDPGRERHSIDEVLAAARARLDRVEPEALETERKAGAVIVEIRPIEQRTRNGALPDAIVIDRNVLEWRLPGMRASHPDHISEVEIRFVAETPQRTRLDLEHRNIERHGPGQEGVRDGVDDDAGWTLYLNRYADLLTTSA